MRKTLCIVVLLAVGCRGEGQRPEPEAARPEPSATPTHTPRDVRDPGPYAYSPDWTVPPQEFAIVSEVQFGSTHALADCTRELAQGLIDHPDTRMFAGNLVARNEYGDAFHAHLVAGELDTLLTPGEDGIRVKAEQGTLVLVTSPLRVESPMSTSLVPACALSIRIEQADPALLAAQPFVTAVRPKEGVDEIYAAVLPHNEGEAILSLYEPGKRHIDEAVWAHGKAVLKPRFLVEGDGWQRVGTYPFPPELPPDAAGTQFILLELADGAKPVSIPLPGRPVISAPARPVRTRADVFVSFYGLTGVKTRFMAAHGFAGASTPVMETQSLEVKEGLKNHATTIDLSDEEDEPRTVFYTHRVAAEWREAGGFGASIRPMLPQAAGPEKAAVFETETPARPEIRSSASAFLRQIRFTGLKPRPTPAAGGASVVPGSIAYDAARGLSGLAPVQVSVPTPPVGGSGGSTTSQSVTNVFINVTHDGDDSVIGDPPIDGPVPLTAPRPRNPYEIVGGGTGSGHGLTTAGSAPGLQDRGRWNDPTHVYTRDPRTGQVYSQVTPYGQSLGSQAAGQSLTGTGGYGYDPYQGTVVPGPSVRFIRRKQAGW